MKFHLVDNFDIWFSITMRIVRVEPGRVPSFLHAQIEQSRDENYLIAPNAEGPFFTELENVINRFHFQIGHLGCVRDPEVADVVETSDEYKRSGGELLDWRTWYGCLIVIDKPDLDKDGFDFNTYGREESNVQELGSLDLAEGIAPYKPEDVILRVRYDKRITVGIDAVYKEKKYRVKTVETVENDRLMLVTLGILNAENVLRYRVPDFAYRRWFADDYRGSISDTTG